MKASRGTTWYGNSGIIMRLRIVGVASRLREDNGEVTTHRRRFDRAVQRPLS